VWAGGNRPGGIRWGWGRNKIWEVDGWVAGVVLCCVVLFEMFGVFGWDRVGLGFTDAWVWRKGVCVKALRFGMAQSIMRSRSKHLFHINLADRPERRRRGGSSEKPTQ